MSLFLGKIHYWLFNKILWFEKLEDKIINLAKEEGFEVEKLGAEIQNKYGEKLPNKPLEELIETSNIHGWLQNQIHCAERRMAAWTKLLIEADEKNYSKLEEIYKSQGIVAANEIKSEGRLPFTPEELFNCINDYILDGMPCDRVNEVILKDEDKIEWVQRICVHKDIWEEVGCKVDYFYDLRNAWIKYFVNELNNDYEYDLKEGNTKTIKRR
ncbi:hypothetical protein [Terrisporobacter glycolicus]|uniref:DUF550 domain-containing protein n=1 Tax=Terrisporobacter glycolicus ATCC 14880 = DSM 1288 TaxID=1121315 RepID=A0ABZ2EQX3_9FIRM|nr:hypothetical protein [Terrisporobacter glycolicus]